MSYKASNIKTFQLHLFDVKLRNIKDLEMYGR